MVLHALQRELIQKVLVIQEAASVNGDQAKNISLVSGQYTEEDLSMHCYHRINKSVSSIRDWPAPHARRSILL